MILEDQSGRVKITKNEVMHPSMFVTGTVLAIKGCISTNGYFEPSDFTLPGLPEIHQMPEEYSELVSYADENLQRDIFEDLENKEFVAFVSGVEFGEMITSHTERLSQWISGEMGTKMEKLLSSRISRIV